MKINRTAQKIVQTLPDASALTAYFSGWAAASASTQELTHMGARSILRAAGLLDDALISDFLRVMATETGLRLALYDLVTQTNHLGQVEPLQPDADFVWEPLLLTIFAGQLGYDLTQFDVSSPPAAHTPAGIVLHQTVQFMRTQSQRSATERDRLARHLTFTGDPQHLALDDLTAGSQPATPPHYRTPVPVRYPEFNPEVQVSAEELPQTGTQPPALQIGPQIKITAEDLPTPPSPAPVQPPTAVRPTPPRPAANRGQSSFSRALRDLFRHESLKTTKLRVIVQEYPDGPGLYGLQVSVSSRSIKSFVAGTTDRQGRFLCELPVRLTSGLTYDIDVVWPADLGGNTERKSITINADRTEFNLPFYKRLATGSRS